jgi:hypothetical protein
MAMECISHIARALLFVDLALTNEILCNKSYVGDIIPGLTPGKPPKKPQ